MPLANKVHADSNGRLDIEMFYIGQLPHDSTDYLYIAKELNLDAALASLRKGVTQVYLLDSLISQEL